MKQYKIKTDSKGSEHFIEVDEDGRSKYRNKMTHLRPKKKKRK